MIVRKMMNRLAVCLIAAILCAGPQQGGAAPVPPPDTYDICVYGGTAAGVIAAYSARMMGKTVLLIEPGRNLGGMTSGGLGYTDIGNKFAITGLARDFYRRVGQHYNKFEQWLFEPHVAENLMKDYIKRGKVPVLYEWRITSAQVQQGTINAITLESSVKKPGSKTIRAKMFIDCSYEGDLMARAGVSYTVGREANSQYNETYNGVQLLEQHQFPDGVDPYKVPGKPESGLLWGISPARLAESGSGDKLVQAYNYRICLSSDPANRLPITKPENYDPSRYELLLRVMEKTPWKNLRGGFKWDLMPNHKTDINNFGAFSTDMIGMNHDYPEADYDTRARIIKAHEDYTKGLLYFVGNDERVPAHIRDLMKEWGYPKDEYVDNGHWSFQLYVREARRMKGAYVMTQANCQGREVVEDGIGLAAYTMDSHNCQRIVVNGMVKNEGDVQKGGFGPYPIAYRSLTPVAAECRNLLVPVCLSASHIAYGSIRMEPVFMVLGQTSAVAAAMAINSNKAVQDIDVKALQQKLQQDPLLNGSTPEVLVDNENKERLQTSGQWVTKKMPHNYGSSLSYTEAGGSIRVTPALQRNGRYTIYYYNTQIQGKAPSAVFAVEHAGGNGNTTVQLGAQLNEWVPVGTYEYRQGKPYTVNISLPQGVQGTLVADALLFVPK